MKARIFFALLACMWAFTGTVPAEEAPRVVKDLAGAELAAMGKDPVIVAAVKKANAEDRSLDDVKAMDERWKSDAGITDYMKPLMENDCAVKLNEILNSKDFYAEIFVMDSQGANVCMTHKTSDYWQGDEAKFEESFAGGTGAVFVDEVEFDDSAQAYLVQVSVPVMDGDAAIGAITFGIDVDKVEQ